MTTTLLVTGASGHLGQRVLYHLLHTLRIPADHIIATTRYPDSLAKWAAAGISVRVADFDNDETVARAFRGADRLLLISTDADNSYRRVQQHKLAIAAAAEAGVTHLTYTSMPNPPRSLILFAPDHSATEEALRDSPLRSWAVLRNHWYFENLLQVLTGISAEGGIWFTAAANGRCADIARDDIALAAAYVLSGRSSTKRIYTLSGGEALTPSEKAMQISAAIGRPIRVVSVSVEELASLLVDSGIPNHAARVLASFDANAAAGHMGKISGDFKTITGREPRSFASWLAANKPALLTL